MQPCAKNRTETLMDLERFYLEFMADTKNISETLANYRFSYESGNKFLTEGEKALLQEMRGALSLASRCIAKLQLDAAIALYNA